MIPRFKPYIGIKELLAPLLNFKDNVESFEKKFSECFNCKYGIAFPYGRSALWAFFKAMDISNAEVIMPAYTCSVVAHAVVLSGNIPRFVDITMSDYNMDLNDVKKSITAKTKVIIATHLFGYPLDIVKLQEIVKNCENKFNNKIWIIHDSAHAFNAKWHGKSVVTEGDMAFFGLNISKIITSIFGGMIVTNNAELANKMRYWRDNNFIKPGLLKGLARWLYLFASYVAFKQWVYGGIKFLQEKTMLLNYLTRSYHLDGIIHFPKNYLELMTNTEARVGIQQLKKYDIIISARIANAKFYSSALKVSGKNNSILPPIVDGATYSHYVIFTEKNKFIINKLLNENIELGELIEYSIPELTEYNKYVDRKTFPNASICSKNMINLPVYAELTLKDKQKISRLLNYEI